MVCVKGSLGKYFADFRTKDDKSYKLYMAVHLEFPLQDAHNNFTVSARAHAHENYCFFCCQDLQHPDGQVDGWLLNFHEKFNPKELEKNLLHCMQIMKTTHRNPSQRVTAEPTMMGVHDVRRLHGQDSS